MCVQRGVSKKTRLTNFTLLARRIRWVWPQLPAGQENDETRLAFQAVVTDDDRPQSWVMVLGYPRCYRPKGSVLNVGSLNGRASPKTKKRKLLQHESKFHIISLFCNRNSWSFSEKIMACSFSPFGELGNGIAWHFRMPCAACSAWRHIDLWEKGWVGWGIGFQHGWFHPLVEDANPNTHLQLELSQVYWSLLVVKLFCNQRERAQKTRLKCSLYCGMFFCCGSGIDKKSFWETWRSLRKLPSRMSCWKENPPLYRIYRWTYKILVYNYV